MSYDNSPLVTVLIPVYNRPSVTSTIKSILGQTYSNLEVLIVDNASTDTTVKEIESIDDPRIRLLINEENKGQTFSLNRGLKEAKGKYIARIDSDDIAVPERIEKQVRFMEENPEYVLIGSWVRFISDDDKLGMVVKMPVTDEGLRLMHTVACGMYHPSAMYKTDTIRVFDISYDPEIHMAEDYDLWVKLMEHGKACNLGEALIYYRRGNDNDSRRHENVMRKESTEIRRRVCGKLECSEEQRTEIYNIIDIEDKKRKSLLQCIIIHQFYKKYISKNIDKTSIDYNILRQHFRIKEYGSCFAYNSSWYAHIIRKLYRLLRNTKNRLAGVKK